MSPLITFKANEGQGTWYLPNKLRKENENAMIVQAQQFKCGLLVDQACQNTTNFNFLIKITLGESK